MSLYAQFDKGELKRIFERAAGWGSNASTGEKASDVEMDEAKKELCSMRDEFLMFVGTANRAWNSIEECATAARVAAEKFGIMLDKMDKSLGGKLFLKPVVVETSGRYADRKRISMVFKNGVSVPKEILHDFSKSRSYAARIGSLKLRQLQDVGNALMEAAADSIVAFETGQPEKASVSRNAAKFVVEGASMLAHCAYYATFAMEMRFERKVGAFIASVEYASARGKANQDDVVEISLANVVSVLKNPVYVPNKEQRFGIEITDNAESYDMPYPESEAAKCDCKGGECSAIRAIKFKTNLSHQSVIFWPRGILVKALERDISEIAAISERLDKLVKSIDKVLSEIESVKL